MSDRFQGILTELLPQRIGRNYIKTQKTDQEKPQITLLSELSTPTSELSTPWQDEQPVTEDSAKEGGLVLPSPAGKPRDALEQRLRLCAVCPDCPSKAFLVFLSSL